MASTPRAGTTRRAATLPARAARRSVPAGAFALTALAFACPVVYYECARVDGRRAAALTSSRDSDTHLRHRPAVATTTAPRAGGR